ncbi:MAG: restriction endonuclease subunit S [Actinomycetota bacterium]
MTESPEGWTLATVGDITEHVSKHRPEDRPNDQFDYVDISSIHAHNIVASKRLVGKDAPSRARQLVKAGDTILSTVRTYLKNTALVPSHLDGATASTGFSVLRPKAGIVEPRFLFFRVLENKFVNQLSERQTGTSYPAVRDRDVRAMRIDLPPSAEQQRIVEAIEEQFSRLDAGVESLHGARRDLDLLRASILQGAVKDASQLGDLVRVDEVASVQLGRQRSPAHHKGPYMRPYLRAANVTWNGVSLEDVKEMNFPPEDFDRFRLSSGDILLNEASGSPEEVGKPAIWDGSIPDACFQNTLLRVLPNNSMDRRFLHIVFYAAAFNGGFAKVSRGVNIMHLGKAGLAAWKVPVPPVDEQVRIVADVERQLSIIEAIAKSIDVSLQRSDSLCQSILSRAFAGRLIASITST